MASVTTAGYSGTPLPAKLGIRPGSRVLVDCPPRDFVLDVPPDVIRRAPYDVILAFCLDARRLQLRFTALAGRLSDSGRRWIAWPKRSSGVPTDLSDDAIRRHGLAAGLVDIKVCAIDATWSGLAFVTRVADRRG